MDGKLRDADTKDDSGLSFEGLRKVSSDFRVTVRDVRTVEVKFVWTILE